MSKTVENSRRLLPARADMRTSVCEGIFASVYTGLAGPVTVYLTSFALLIGAGPRELAFLMSAGPMLMAAQILGPWATRFARGKRKLVALLTSGVGRAALFIIPFTTLLLPVKYALPAFLVTFLVSQVFMGIANSVWTSWMGDTVPEQVRGRFFGHRAQYQALANLSVGYLASVFLDLTRAEMPRGLMGEVREYFGLNDGLFGADGAIYGYLIVFVAAGLFGLTSTAIARRQKDRPARDIKVKPASFVRPFREKDFVLFLSFFAFWFFSIYIGAPFWQPFMINYLGMPFLEIQIYSTIAMVATIFFVKPWGRLVDRLGNKPLFRLLIAISVVNSGVYIFMTPQNHWWIFIEAVTSGAMWAGMGICMTNLLFAATPPGKRDVHVAIFSVVTGVFSTCSVFLSGYIEPFIPKDIILLGSPVLTYKYFFVATALARLAAEIPLSFVRENRARSFREALLYIGEGIKVRYDRIFISGPFRRV